jgi:DNA-binding NarL/FixJ family response regulator
MRVILADDAVLVREGLARLLTERGFEVLAQAGTAEQLLKQVGALRPDIAVIDIRMPPTYTNEGLVAAEQIRDRHPQTAPLILSQYVEVDYALKLLKGSQGGVGYLLKERIVEVAEFTLALHTIAAGGTVIEPTLVNELLATPRAADPLSELSAREREVLALMAEGRTDRGISEQLFVTRKTVEAHVRSILRKLNLPNDAGENRRVHAVLAYLRPRTPRTLPPPKQRSGSDSSFTGKTSH